MSNPRGRENLIVDNFSTLRGSTSSKITLDEDAHLI